MSRRLSVFVAALGWATLSGATWTGLALAQPPESGGREGRRGMPPLPILTALDADGDGEISTEEMNAAADALKSLDKDKDGKLILDEIRPEFGRRVREARAERGGDRGPDGPRHHPRRHGPDADFEDDDSDGRRAGRDEDDDNQGDVDRPPHKKRHGKPHGPGHRGGPEGGPRPPREGFGGPPHEGFGPPPGFGPPSPEEFIERAMQFDTNEDGQLNRDELRAMAESMPRRRHGRPRPTSR
ncbi:MAG: hypothetical protein O3C60_14125 [Planctomycetota bacterium]|nr:hypothetical protein [Planctomycetota bacterium]